MQHEPLRGWAHPNLGTLCAGTGDRLDRLDVLKKVDHMITFFKSREGGRAARPGSAKAKSPVGASRRPGWEALVQAQVITRRA